MKTFQLPFKEKISGRKLTTFNIGGEIDFFIEVKNIEELVETLSFVKKKGVEYRIIGAGSNLLIPDIGIKGLVIKLGGDFKTYSIEKENGRIKNGEVRAGAGYSLMLLANKTGESGLSGLEFAGGIPASVGGAVFMNAGAHKGEISEVLKSVKIIDADLNIKTILKSDLKISYRKGGIPSGAIILEADFELRESTKEECTEKKAHFLNYRKKTQPLQMPSAGSIFKNPSDILSAGQLIDELGLKGKKIGDVLISELHANWIVNPSKNGRAGDVKKLIALCQEKALKERGIEIFNEVVCW